MKKDGEKAEKKLQLSNWAATLGGERNKILCAINNELNWLFIVFVFVFVFLLYSICHCLYIKREGTISLSRPFSLCEAPERARLSWLTQLSHPPGRFVPKVHIYIFQQQYHHQRARLSYIPEGFVHIFILTVPILLHILPTTCALPMVILSLYYHPVDGIHLIFQYWNIDPLSIFFYIDWPPRYMKSRVRQKTWIH